jgi:hypothetical protein
MLRGDGAVNVEYQYSSGVDVTAYDENVWGCFRHRNTLFGTMLTPQYRELVLVELG